MQQFRDHLNFAEAQLNEAYEQPLTGLLTFRSEGLCHVYWTAAPDEEEILVGYGNQPFQVEMPPGQFRIHSEHAVWVSQRGVQQITLAASDEVFTTLDRPAPLSPEMAAIARLVRQNDLERENMRIRFENVEQHNAELRREQSRTADKLAVDEDTEDAQKASDPTKRGKTKPPKRADPKAKKPSDDDESDVRSRGGDSDED